MVVVASWWSLAPSTAQEVLAVSPPTWPSLLPGRASPSWPGIQPPSSPPIVTRTLHRSLQSLHQSLHDCSHCTRVSSVTAPLQARRQFSVVVAATVGGRLKRGWDREEGNKRTAGREGHLRPGKWKLQPADILGESNPPQRDRLHRETMDYPSLNTVIHSCKNILSEKE